MNIVLFTYITYVCCTVCLCNAELLFELIW